MKIIIVSIIATILLSCGGSSSSISKQLSASDSLVINFTAPQSGSISKSVTTTEAKAIHKLARFVDGKKAEEFKCGYNGSLLFFSNGKLLNDVSFNYSETGCQHFLLSVDGKLEITEMSNEAVDFLKSLADGKDWY